MCSIDYAVLRDEFRRLRQLRVDIDGAKSLWIVDATESCDGPSILVGYEGGGFVRFGFDRPLNLFRLYSGGFSGGIASRVLEILEGMFPPNTLSGVSPSK